MVSVPPNVVTVLHFSPEVIALLLVLAAQPYQNSESQLSICCDSLSPIVSKGIVALFWLKRK